ncbi:Xaa-Pro peptidase family protein [Cognatishimia sp. F0-27]|uniref:M24 family metallopeptidase n=1 Tax=Cognatishimia sp. F0-27 TaxID=2816855 RepID=UPI001D0C79BD|nr:Xaa-Pro peptidase family protein [Cognatishimia sp. F0-27]MCC1493385.1 aminopeptidase P family protein [Cognatishimia sp. F0-27]
MAGDFAPEEFRARVARAQRRMAEHGLAAILLTTEPEIRYVTGFLTRFWESPSRPWFVVIPAAGDPIAVIPAIGAPLMARGWISDIRAWDAPQPGDDGVSLLVETLRSVAGGGRIGMPMGPESQLRMPLVDFRRVEAAIAPATVVPDAGIMAGLRAVKSAAEIARIETACAIGGRAFARVGEIARPGRSLAAVFRDFQRLCLEEGADDVRYLAGGAGPLGYDDVISPATDAPLVDGDVLMLDTGLTHGGYFCDYDRNFAMGRPDRRVQSAWHRLIEASDAGLAAARPGARACDLWSAMNAICGTTGGRLGHGLGMQLTEGLSLIAADETVLEPGMVLTLEPAVAVAEGASLVHEENIVITETGARLLSPAASRDLPRL